MRMGKHIKTSPGQKIKQMYLLLASLLVLLDLNHLIVCTGCKMYVHN